MKFILPLPPSINQTYRGAAGGGRLILTDKADAYKTEMGYRLNQVDSTPIRGKCIAWLSVYMPYPVKGDHHNNLKMVLDLLEGHAYKNDSQVVDLRVKRYYDKKNPRIEIKVRAIA